MVPFPITVTLVRRTKGAPDAAGNDTFTTSASTVKALFAPGTSVEQIQGQDTVTTSPIVYLEASTDPRAIDAVVIAGTTYEVDGVPNVWTSPWTGWTPGVEVRLRTVSG
jgi:hypothetical protein